MSDESGVPESLHPLAPFLQFRVAPHRATNTSVEYHGASAGHRFLSDPPGDPDTIDWDLYKTPAPEQNEPK